jgi:SH3-like domain-containing protein
MAWCVKRIMLLFALLLLAPLAHAADQRPVPYWASIAAGDALMRAGPARTYPATWRYRRSGLPVRVVQLHEHWRKVQEMDGTEGWMSSALLTAERTAIIVGTENQPLRGAPDSGAKILWMAQPGVIGKIAHCSASWCEFDVMGKVGYISKEVIWGIDPAETID